MRANDPTDAESRAEAAPDAVSTDGGTPTGDVGPDGAVDQVMSDSEASPVPDFTFLGSWRYLWEVDRWGVVTLGLFLLAAAVFLFRLPDLVDSGGFDNFVSVAFGHLWTLVVLLLFTWFTRTVSLRTLVAYWLVGVLFVANVVLFLGGLATDLLGSGWVTSAFLLPLVEEGLKLFPVAVFLFLSVRSGGWERTASDALVLGFAVGAGFAFAEEMLAGRSVGHGFGDGIWGLLFPTFAKLGGGIFGGPTRWAMAHGGWTAFAALGLGVAVMFRHRLFVWPIPLFTFGLVTFDHMVINLDGTGRTIFNLLLARGKIPMWLFLLAIPTVILLEIFVIHRSTKRLNGYFDAIPVWEYIDLFRERDGWFTLLQFKNALNYSRWRRSGVLAIRRYQIGVTDDDHLPVIESTAGWLLTMRDAASLVDPDPSAGGYGLSADPVGVGGTSDPHDGPSAVDPGSVEVDDDPSESGKDLDEPANDPSESGKDLDESTDDPDDPETDLDESADEPDDPETDLDETGSGPEEPSAESEETGNDPEETGSDPDEK